MPSRSIANGVFAVGMLGDADPGIATVHLIDDPIGIERLVSDQAAKAQPADQGCYANYVVALARQQHKPNLATEPIG